MTRAIALTIFLVWRAQRKPRPRHEQPATGAKAATARATRSAARAVHAADPGPGLLLGHALAQHHYVPFGDPRPQGHLGSPSAVTFWAGMGMAIDDEDEGKGQFR